MHKFNIVSFVTCLTWLLSHFPHINCSPELFKDLPDTGTCEKWLSYVLPPACSTHAASSPKPHGLFFSSANVSKADSFLLCATCEKGQLWKTSQPDAPEILPSLCVKTALHINCQAGRLFVQYKFKLITHLDSKGLISNIHVILCIPKKIQFKK